MGRLGQGGGVAASRIVGFERGRGRRGQGRRGLFSTTALVTRRAALALALAAVLWPQDAGANPQGGTVVGGAATIVETSPSRLDILQATERAIIDWRSFSIGEAEHTNFSQPSTDSVALNRVTGGDLSTIAGRLSANGNIVLINPNGVIFTSTARIDVHGLIASTSDIGNDDFMAGRLDFSAAVDPSSFVINRGEITAAEGGLVALVAPWVENSGVIAARLGRVELASGGAFTVDLYGDGLIQLALAEPGDGSGAVPGELSSAARVSNLGLIAAEGGVVALSVADAQGLVDNVINMEGIIEARTVAQSAGRIILDGGASGIVSVTGTLDASGADAGEIGGAVAVLGEKVGLFDGARVDVSGDAGGGTALIGGNYQGSGPERNAQFTYLSNGMGIDADALTQGDGGTVIVWADQGTRFEGTITARGGAQSGDGGFIEVSGKGTLAFTGSVDLSAPNGASGTLLLDPNNITIVAFAPDGDINIGLVGDTFETTGDTSVLEASSIVAALGTGNVIIETGTAGTNAEAGDILIRTEITAPANANSLTLLAHGDIIFGDFFDFDDGGAVLLDSGSIDFSASSGTLSLLADGISSNGVGAIINNSSAAFAISMGSGGLRLVAGSGIGTSVDPITLANDGTIAATTTTSGGIFLESDFNNDIFIGTVGATSGLVSAGDVSLVNLEGSISILQDIVAAGTGSINVQALGDITISGLVLTGSGFIDLLAGNDINITPVGMVKTNNGGTITAAADNDIEIFGVFFLQSPDIFNPIPGNLTMIADNDGNGVGAIIRGVGPVFAPFNVFMGSGGTLLLSAGSGIGTALRPLLLGNTANATVAGTTTTSGGIFLNSEFTGFLSIGTVGETVGLVSAGDVRLRTEGRLDINAGVTAGGNITFQADDMAISAAVTTTGATGEVTLEKRTASGTIVLGVNPEFGFGLTDAELDQISTSLLRIGNNTIFDSGAITIASAISPAGTSSLELFAGADISGGTNTITVSNLTLNADTGIDVDTVSSTITATNSTSGAIDISNTGNLALSIAQSGIGSVTATAAGDLDVTQLLAPDSAITLTALGGTLTMLGNIDTTSSFTANASTLVLQGSSYAAGANFTVNGDTTLLFDTTVTTGAGGGDIRFAGTIDTDIDSLSPSSLTLSAGTGAIEVQGAAGATLALASLTATGATIDLNDVTTAGIAAGGNDGRVIVSSLGPVTLAGIDTSASGFGFVTILSQSGSITASGDIVTGGSDGDVFVSSTSIGGGISLAGIDTTAAGSGFVHISFFGSGSINVGNIVTGGSDGEVFVFTNDGNIALAGIDTTAAGSGFVEIDTRASGSLTLSGNIVTGGGNGGVSVFINNGDISLAGIDTTAAGAGSVDMTASAGTIDVAGNIATGGTDGSLVATATAILLRDVATVGAQTYNGAVSFASTYTTGGAFTVTGATTLSSDTSIATSGGDITFDGTVDGDQVDFAQNLTLSSGSGAVAFNGRVGDSVALGEVDATGSSSLTASGTLLIADSLRVVDDPLPSEFQVLRLLPGFVSPPVVDPPIDPPIDPNVTIPPIDLTGSNISIGEQPRPVDASPVPNSLQPFLTLADLGEIAPGAGTDGGESVIIGEVDSEAAAEVLEVILESCPDVILTSLSWQNTPADAAFNRNPMLLPYSVDEYCAGYTLTIAGRGSAEAYQGLTFVRRDFWTDLKQSRDKEVISEILSDFGLPEREDR